MKYAIIENEVFARLNLQNIVETLRPGYQLVFTAETVADAIAGISSNSDLDLVFMDIELDDGNCFEIFDKIMVKTPVIFTTAYDDYAIKAFKVNSIDYLLKPVVEDDMKAAIEKFEEHTSPLRQRHRLPAVEQGHGQDTGKHTHPRHRRRALHRPRALSVAPRANAGGA